MFEKMIAIKDFLIDREVGIVHDLEAHVNWQLENCNGGIRGFELCVLQTAADCNEEGGC